MRRISTEMHGPPHFFCTPKPLLVTPCLARPERSAAAARPELTASVSERFKKGRGPGWR
nr:MAG TPA: hypothetical protein [Bacteriophage sp.]DAJ53091.1 MAG TPA: hypothetical protein [Caudoviricetes sp.]